MRVSVGEMRALGTHYGTYVLTVGMQNGIRVSAVPRGRQDSVFSGTTSRSISSSATGVSSDVLPRVQTASGASEDLIDRAL